MKLCGLNEQIADVCFFQIKDYRHVIVVKYGTGKQLTANELRNSIAKLDAFDAQKKL